MIFMPKRFFLRLGVPCPSLQRLKQKRVWQLKKSSHKQLCALKFFKLSNGSVAPFCSSFSFAVVSKLHTTCTTRRCKAPSLTNAERFQSYWPQAHHKQEPDMLLDGCRTPALCHLCWVDGHIPMA